MAEVVLEHVWKEYKGERKAVRKGGDGKTAQPERKAIDDVSFTVRDKEFMVMVGPSGCGKSTLLRMIAGLEAIGGGTISIDGQVINNLSPRDRDIAMVFQNYALYPHMTVYDNMGFGLKLKGCGKIEIRKRVMQVAELLEIVGELDRKPKALSGGQRQRVAIGRAIIRRPKVFLFDEPLSNLDAKLRSQMRIELQKLHREIDATMIYVTHDQTEAMVLGHRIAVLNKGRLEQLDSPMEVYNKPKSAFVAGFIGSPAMNFVRGRVEGGYFVPEAGGWKIGLNASAVGVGQADGNAVSVSEGKPILLGVRPEHVVICEEGDRQAPDCVARVIALENMGNEQLVYFSLGEQNLVVRRSQMGMVDTGQERGLKFLMDRVVWLDAEDGNG